MKIIRHFFLAGVILVVVLVSCDNNKIENFFDFEISEGAVSILKYKGEAEKIKIPAKIKELPVTVIGENAFSGSKNLTSVFIPDSITSIGDAAFMNCSSLTSVNIPDSVTSIGKAAFRYTNLKSIIIPDSVTSIQEETFWNCSFLSVIIPNSVINIGELAFFECRSLASVIISDGVISIGDYAFKNCVSLTNIIIPNSVISIGQNAFGDCTSLTDVTISNSVSSIGSFAFASCDSLTMININAGNSAYTSEDGILYDKNKTVLYTYPAGKTNEYFTIPDSVTSIEGYSFYRCKSLTSLTIPKNVIKIEAYAFSKCTGLTSVTFEGSIASDNFSTKIDFPKHYFESGPVISVSRAIKDMRGNDAFNSPFDGDLRDKFYATDKSNGTPGTYSTTAPVGSDSIWTLLNK